MSTAIIACALVLFHPLPLGPSVYPSLAPLAPYCFNHLSSVIECNTMHTHHNPIKLCCNMPCYYSSFFHVGVNNEWVYEGRLMYLGRIPILQTSFLPLDDFLNASFMSLLTPGYRDGVVIAGVRCKNSVWTLQRQEITCRICRANYSLFQAVQTFADFVTWGGTWAE